MHGMGSFAIEPISCGETVTVWAHAVIDRPEAAEVSGGELHLRANGQFIWLPESWSNLDGYDTAEERLNHSCDPNVWMDDEVTLSARRDIAVGEELTGDYALWDLDPAHVCPFACRCGSSLCRSRITGRDWELPDLQRRYSGHWHPTIEARIATR
jgi:SET domain-containing protein